MALSSHVKFQNPHLLEMESDYLYHINIAIDCKDSGSIEKEFGDVKFVCMGGTASRMQDLARHIRTVLQVDEDKELVDLAQKGHRYAIFKVGPVLCCSHGIGMSSMSVLLHELLKLVTYAKCKDPVFIRVGTCGGLGVKPGTVVVSKNVYNGYLESNYELAILGKKVVRDAKLDMTVLDEMLKCKEEGDDFPIVAGNTMGTLCFYEGQGRLDGAVCEYTLEEKMAFLQKCYSEYGIRNIEMEAPMFAALTLKAGVKAATVCVTLLNRLNGDQVAITHEQKLSWEKYPLTVVGRYIQHSLRDGN